MRLTRRLAVGTLLAAPAILRAPLARAATRTLKISHQFPGGTIDQGDFRDRLTRRFAADVAKRSNGELAFEFYPGSSLMKTVAQFSAVRRGALDLSLYPLAYAGGEIPEVNIGLMPALVSSYAQGMAWKTSEIGRQLTDLLDKRGVKILTWVWQAGGIASRTGAVVAPDDTKGLKIRGGSREMDLMLKAAGGIISSVPSDEIYAAMQTGSLRRRTADLVACVFCAYFAYKSAQLFHEAWDEGQTTPSAWGSPLWIPYLCMAAGMALLALQQALQALKGPAK